MRYPPEIEDFFNSLILHVRSDKISIHAGLLYESYLRKFGNTYDSIGKFIRPARRFLNDQHMNSIEIDTSFDDNGNRKYYFNFGRTKDTSLRIHSLEDPRLNDCSRVYLKLIPKKSDILRPPHIVVAPGENNTHTGEIHSVVIPTTETPATVTPTTSIRSEIQSYPLLRSLGLEPNFDSEQNCNQISNLLSELVNLHRKNNRQNVIHIRRKQQTRHSHPNSKKQRLQQF